VPQGAREGANLFLTWRHLAPVEVVAKEVVSAGGSAEAAEVDALDERAVDKHLQFVIDKAGPEGSERKNFKIETQCSSHYRLFYNLFDSSFLCFILFLEGFRIFPLW
jgi:hypothetical protein